jgi:hypothetical protein
MGGLPRPPSTLAPSSPRGAAPYQSPRPFPHGRSAPGPPPRSLVWGPPPGPLRGDLPPGPRMVADPLGPPRPPALKPSSPVMKSEPPARYPSWPPGAFASARWRRCLRWALEAMRFRVALLAVRPAGTPRAARVSAATSVPWEAPVLRGFAGPAADEDCVLNGARTARLIIHARHSRARLSISSDHTTHLPIGSDHLTRTIRAENRSEPIGRRKSGRN